MTAAGTGAGPGSGPLDDTAEVRIERTGRHPVVRPPVIEVEDVRKTYRNGTLEVEALRGVSFDDRRPASTWPSWARRARASRPSCTSSAASTSPRRGRSVWPVRT